MRTRRRWAPILVCVALAAAGCSGGTSSSSQATTVSPAARQQGALQAGRACRMWTEVMTQAFKGTLLTPAQAAPFDAKSGAIATVANAASAADPTWNNLATDIAGGNDFASAALPDINGRIQNDCKQVPADVVKTVDSEPDPFSSTTTAP
jgi:hypothetical protein